MLHPDAHPDGGLALADKRLLDAQRSAVVELLKDFGRSIPGHGGFMDRFDCQLIMAAFVHVYLHSFVRRPSPNNLLNLLLTLRPHEQVEFLDLVSRHFNLT